MKKKKKNRNNINNNYIEKCVNFYDINQKIYKNLIDSRSTYDIPI